MAFTGKDNNMSTLPACPQCHSELTYEDGSLYICPECAHEWPVHAGTAPAEEGVKVYRDSAGNVLQDGDTVSVIKDLKLKGSAGVVKMGTKVKNIRLVDGDHDIDCKIDGFGAMSLKLGVCQEGVILPRLYPPPAQRYPSQTMRPLRLPVRRHRRCPFRASLERRRHDPLRCGSG